MLITRAATSPAVTAGDNLQRAVLYMGYAAILIPLLNASAKYLGTKYPIAEIVWARYAGHFIYMVILFAPRRGLSLLVSRRPGLQFIRSALLFTSTAIYFSALHYVPLATATAIGFTAPFIVTALAPLVLGERVGTRRWIAVGLGFVGALAVVRPGEDAVPLAAFLVFGSAVTSASYQLITRKLAFHDPAETSITYIAVVGFLLATLALPFFWRTPDSLMDIAVFVALGLFGGFGHYFMVRAYEMAPAPFVSPFNYGQLVGTVALGYFIFAQFPDVWTWLGAAIIVASGLDMLFAEARGKARVPE